MTNSRHHLWQKRWRIDAATHSAVHECGLVVRFDLPPSTGIKGLCVPINLDTTVAALAVKNGCHNAPIMARRLLREAAEIYGCAPHERPRLT